MRLFIKKKINLLLFLMLFAALPICCNAHTMDKATMAKAKQEMSKYYDKLPASARKTIENDPLKGYNKIMFALNNAAYAVVLDPVRKIYTVVAPSQLRTGLSNGLNNLKDTKVATLNMLQFSPRSSVRSLSRFFINTIFGFFGMVDVAKHLGIARNIVSTDQVLGVWQIPSGPYLVLPILGPSTIRGAFSFAHDLSLFGGYKTDGMKLLPDTQWALQDPIVAAIRAHFGSFQQYLNAQPYMAIFMDSFAPYVMMKSMWLQRMEFTILQKQHALYQGSE